jgi:proteasome alpha subunit
LAIVFKGGVLFATVKPKTPLMVPESIEKIFQIDDHAAAVAAGLLADARVLANQVRIRAQIHRITYEEPMDIWSLARSVADRMQISTLYAGLRPYGVSFLIGGVDATGTHLIEIDPSGMLYEWYAYAIGRGAVIANKILRQRWKQTLTESEAIKIALEILSKTEKEGEADMAIIREDEKKFKKLTEEEIRKLKS